MAPVRPCQRRGTPVGVGRLRAGQQLHPGLGGEGALLHLGIAGGHRGLYIGDEAVLHVLSRTAEAAPAVAGAIDHFAFNATDLPAFERRLEAAGQPFESRRLADSDTWQIFLTDPDGARVELSFPMQARQARASAVPAGSQGA